MIMNETLKVIKNRRSIRMFTPEQINDSDLQTILDAGLYAPNGRNEQKWHFTVIQDKNVLERMLSSIKENIQDSGNDFLKERASSPSYNTFYHAPTVIMISGNAESKLVQIDCGAAAQTIALAAESLNINSCVMTSPGLLFASDKGAQWINELGIPEGYNHIVTVVLGYLNGENPAVPTRNKAVINYVK